VLLESNVLRKIPGGCSLSSFTTEAPVRRAIPLWMIVLLAFAVHGPLLFMQLPAKSYDANFHMFFASHYAQHWFDPWNEKWFAGFSQTTYPPLPQQWMALLSHFVGLPMSYMLVQLAAIMLLPVGVYRYARMWTRDERAASYAAIGSIFLGSLSMLAYQAGQLSTLTAVPLYLNAIPYFYEWSRQGNVRSLIKGLALGLAAAAAHHVTLLFGSVLFILPVIWLALLDRKEQEKERGVPGVLIRAGLFAGIAAAGVGVVLAPYFLALRQNPITQLPIPHASRTNLFLNSEWALNYFLVPYGALLIALPFMIMRASVDRRLRPLLFGFWLTFLFGLGGTTPIPRVLLGRAFEILTFERFTFWATLMMLPVVGLLIRELAERVNPRVLAPAFAAAVLTCAVAVGWTTFRPINQDSALDVQPVVDFLNREGHDQYRYLTLGFGSQLAKVGTYANAGTVDGDYNSARALPEMTKYGAAQFTNSKYYGIAGMESLREMLRHAERYGVKWVFIRDRFYEPIVQFAGWRKVDAFNNGLITLWMKDSIPPATSIQSTARPPLWHGIFWGILPFGTSLIALAAVLFLPDRRRIAERIEFPSRPRVVPAMQEVGR
jgi:hypothetical protein